MRRRISYLSFILLFIMTGCSKGIDCEQSYSRILFLRAANADIHDNTQVYDADTLTSEFNFKIIYSFSAAGITPDCNSLTIIDELVKDETILTCDVYMIIEGDTIASNTNIYNFFESIYPDNSNRDELIYRSNIYSLPTFESSSMRFYIEVPISDGNKIWGAKKFVIMF